jgi:hypothetical protein
MAQNWGSTLTVAGQVVFNCIRHKIGIHKPGSRKATKIAKKGFFKKEGPSVV